MHLPPLSLYIHLPWCVRKCPYCDFNSHASSGPLPEADYVAALLADLRAELCGVQGRRLVSIFFGGGTPSLFSARAIAKVLTAVDAAIGIDAGVEITLEANPGTAERDKFRDYRRAGVNRLSIGVQSFDDAQLRALGRIHSGRDAIAAVATATAAGFEHLNLDLMHGLPGQTPATAAADLHQALALDPDHLSWYQLTLEPNTAFQRTPPVLPAEDALEAIQTEGAAVLAAAGFAQYEISAYARGYQCAHNRNYWEFGDYLGIGAGAHGKLTDPPNARVLRTRKTRRPADYIARAGTARVELAAIPAADLPLEFMLNGLRLNAGVPTSHFPARTGLPLATIASQRQRLVAAGLLLPDPDRFAVTALGRRYLNDVLAVF